ncbi:MAG TPA: small acid-soluble spore protein SspI [Bacilli bacterium]
MNLNLRQAIIERVQDKSEDELHDVIESSVGNEERTLPGLGVLFEIIWQNCEEDTQLDLVSTLKKSLPPVH